MIKNKDKYFEVLNDIKKTLIITRNRIVENANKPFYRINFYL